MGGFQPEIEVPAGNPMRGKAGRKRSLARLRFFRQLWSFPREAPQRYEELIEAVRQYRTQDLREMSRRELASELTRWLSVTSWLQPSLQIAAAYYGAWLTQLRALLELRLGEKTDLFVSQLLAASGNVTSAEQAYRLWDLADLVREETGDRLQTIDALSPRLRRELDRYLDAFGHRGVGEMEIANARWIEDAGYLLEQIAIYVELPKGISPRDMAVKVRREAEEKLSTLPLIMRPLVRWILHRVRLGAALREQAKSACVASMEPLRKIGLEVGRRLVAAGELEDVDDVWQLTLAELEAYLEGIWGGRGAAALAADRKDAWVKWQSEPPPADLITCSPEGQQTVRAKNVHSPSLGEDTWQGTLAAPGYARGSARILLDPSDGDRLQAGDILVAPSTDPGWTPLFLRAAAIVMETGGYLSHGAVVAREFGLPAVINIPGLLTQLQDGDELIVDANASLVTRVAATSKSPSLSHNPVLNAE
jgi:pyruvate,water dikinase